jgi:aflatoxin B1 aldehyde reductase
MASIEAVVGAHNLTMAEVALRWISHHGLMRREHGDAVLIGASSTKHIKQVSKIYLSTNLDLSSLEFFSRI